jgi:hypothetical protein
MRRIALAALVLTLALPPAVTLVGGLYADPALAAAPARPPARSLSLQLPFAVAAVSTVQCNGKPAALLTGGDGTRHRVLVANGLLAIEPFTGCTLPDAPTRPDTLDEGIVTLGTGAIGSAWLAVATLKYRHGILGDVAEAQELRALNRNGDLLRYRLDDNSVFEDRMARMVYVERKDALLVVRTRLDQGAAAALFTLEDGAAPAQRLVLAAESPPLGQPNLWLNPIGADDFDGDGHTEIAVVLTPHSGGTLVLYRVQGSQLVEKYRAPGFSNHQIYSRELGMSAMVDMNGDGIPDLLVPDAKRERLRVVTFAGGHFRELMKTEPAAPIVSAIAVADLDGNGRPDAAWVLDDNTLMALVR